MVIIYLDLRRTILSLSCKITIQDGTDIKSNAPQPSAARGGSSDRPSPADGSGRPSASARDTVDNVGVVNNFLSSIISRVDISLQGHVLTPADHTYPYMTYLKALLFTTDSEKKGLLQAALYYQDDTEHINSYNVVVMGNDGLKR